MERASEGKISFDHAIEAAASSQNSGQVEAEVSGKQLPELISAQK